MQFVINGPDIPDALLQAHEEGRVVFFCGAGISYPAHLPGFAGLVDQLYSALGFTPTAVQRAAIKARQFDTAVGLLECDVVGHRTAVREELPRLLKPDLSAPHATTNHESLLTLATLRDGQIRLITTNFDRIFEEIIQTNSMPIKTFQAPLLPVPKNRWDGLVYLHGLLSASPTAVELDRLVLTSGDFGLAYLIERWAARFVSELFRNFSVCFVGYSINDPVLRYMMDALAADQFLGETSPEMFAFGSFSKGKESESAAQWRAKNVTPILYREHNCHAYLRKTLKAWADTYKVGAQGKEAIVVKYAQTHPQESTPQDNFVGRMLWALSDKSGLPAERFSQINPTPPLDWLLDAFSDERYRHSDLVHFGINPHQNINNDLRFSLIRRPAPYDRAPPMRLVSAGSGESRWDELMLHLAKWLLRHLNDPRLIIWIAERGGVLHEHWAELIRRELERFAALEHDGKTNQLNEIRVQSPNAIPGSLMRSLWFLLLNGRVKSTAYKSDLYRWKGDVCQQGLTTNVRWELRRMLAPQLLLRRRFGGPSTETENPTKVRQLVDYKIVFSSNHVRSALGDLSREPWPSVLPQLLEELQQLLLDTLDLMKQLGEADNFSDHSFWDCPSIEPHQQNHTYQDWVILIELLRDSWLAILASELIRASRIAQAWFDFPYPTFKRLAMFAASHDGCISAEQWVEWLLADDSHWLWSLEVQREVLRLLALQGQCLAGATQARLESAVLLGPPRSRYRDDLEERRWLHNKNRQVWLRLAKLNATGLALGPNAEAFYLNMSALNPTWSLPSDQSDEFVVWTSDGEADRVIEPAPRKRKELLGWLVKPVAEGRLFYEDTWNDVCRTRFFHSYLALRDLALNGEWPAQRWQVALQVWADGNLVGRAWRYAAPLVQAMPENTFQEIVSSITYWLQVASKGMSSHQDIFLDLCRRVLALPLDLGSGTRLIRDGVETYDPVGSAINHPVGQVSQAIINYWFNQKPSDNDLLPQDVRDFFTLLCNPQVDRFRLGRVLLGSRVIALYRVDRDWTEQHLLSFFGWSNPLEARSTWEGFLWSPRLYTPLLIALKPQLMDTAAHYADLGRRSQQYAAFITYMALEKIEGYSNEDFRSLFLKLPIEGLEESADTLAQALEGAADQRESYFKSRIEHFWKEIWPKSRELATPRIAESLARMAIASRGEFPAAMVMIQKWLKPFDHLHFVVNLLRESGLCNRFPCDVLMLLDAVVEDQLWAPAELALCLDQIIQASPELEYDFRYQRLREYLRRKGSWG